MNAELETELRSLDPKEIFVYYALETGALRGGMEDEAHRERVVGRKTQEVSEFCYDSAAIKRPGLEKEIEN